MPRIDFSKVDDAQDFTPLPEGRYPCRIVDIEEKLTQNGDDMWRLTFEVTEGEFEGRKIFDNLVFSDLSLKRVKLLCSKVGIDVTGDVDLNPDMLIDRKCRITVVVEEYPDKNGNARERNSVPFAGFEAIDAG